MDSSLLNFWKVSHFQAIFKLVSFIHYAIMMTKMELKGSDPRMWFKALNIEVLTGFLRSGQPYFVQGP